MRTKGTTVSGTPTAKRAQVSERRKKAIAMRLAGADWQAIADTLGYASRGAAHTDVTRSLEANRREEAAAAEELRQVTVMRYDRLQAAWWKKAIDGDPKAAEIVIKCLAGRAKIEGVEAPDKINVSGGVKYEIVGVSPDEIT
jgi:hypothetical protein